MVTLRPDERGDTVEAKSYRAWNPFREEMMAGEKEGITRRRLGKALALAGTAAVSARPMLGQAPGQAPGGQTPAPPAIGPRVAGVAVNDQLVFGGIGLRNRGMHDLRQLLSDPRVRFAAIADIRDSARETVKSTVD